MLKTYLKTRRLKRFFLQHYQNTNGFALAKAYQPKGHAKPELTYGEICFHAYLRVLEQLPIDNSSRFLELGSSIGKNTLITATMSPAHSVTGIELIPSMHKTSLEILSKAQKDKHLKAMINETQVNLINADFLTVDWSTYDVIFINATAFIEDFWQTMFQKLLQLKPGTQIALISRPLDDPRFTLSHHELLLMTWGYANVFFYTKI
ncbi:MAG: hypothetical protein COV52_04960 [Gammaproteobacteria bacterium CG11_big_fil_rev_8_21_14_0_20_46_22]|nr:MAG: hypothetical protein COW05_01405 [Gammaproteobacteria bacterium CG12_big_fil_rev_8_21_14_0_65_46_12]PIR11246.1 MAG: hypothetical protein COV52_04960 [Gammaproteobacteria bacterium CG11_big_fil_rev_8_21_14_0_20_46_22]